MGQYAPEQQNANQNGPVTQPQSAPVLAPAPHPALSQNINASPHGGTIVLTAPQHRGANPMMQQEPEISTAQKISQALDRLGIDKQKLKAGARRVVEGAMRISDKFAEKNTNELPPWNVALEQKTRKLRQGDKRAFMMIFLVFFGAFCWLYLLYALQHRDTNKQHSGLTDLSQKNTEAAANSNRLFSAKGAENAPNAGAPNGVEAYQGTSGDNYSISPFGSPRGGAPQAADYPGNFNRAVAQSASQTQQGQYAQAAATASNPFGTPAPLAAGHPGVAVQAIAPAYFNPNSATLVAPITLRHAVGVPVGAPLPTGRQRTVVNR